jgi:hypothetical protein
MLEEIDIELYTVELRPKIPEGVGRAIPEYTYIHHLTQTPCGFCEPSTYRTNCVVSKC